MKSVNLKVSALFVWSLCSCGLQVAQALTHGNYVNVRVICSVPATFAGIKTSSNHSLRRSAQSRSIKVIARYDGEHNLYRVSEETLRSLKNQCEKKRLNGSGMVQVRASNSSKKRQLATVLPVAAEEGEHLIGYLQQPLVHKHQSRFLILNRHRDEFLQQQNEYLIARIQELCSFTRPVVTEQFNRLRESDVLYEAGRVLENKVVQLRSFNDLKQYIHKFVELRQQFVDKITASLSGKVFFEGNSDLDTGLYHQVVGDIVSDLLYSGIKSPHLSALLEHFAVVDMPDQLSKSPAFSPGEIQGLENLIKTSAMYTVHTTLFLEKVLGLSGQDSQPESVEPPGLPVQADASLLQCRYPDEPQLMSAEEWSVQESSIQERESGHSMELPSVLEGTAGEHSRSSEAGSSTQMSGVFSENSTEVIGQKTNG